MKKIILILVLLIFISGCTEQIEKSNEEQQLANPASVYCEEQGGTLRMEENEAGQYGICTLPDGTECEEWAYYRGECPKEIEIVCEDYDGNQESCLLYEQCVWDGDESLCDTIDKEGDEEHEDIDEIIDDGTIEGSFQYESPWIIEEGKRIDDGYFWDVSVVQLDDGTYRMYGEKDSKIWSYISDDGLLWEKEDGVRFEGAAFPQVMKTTEGKWRLFYVPSGSAQQNKFLSAISSDGLNFVEEEGVRYKGEGNLEEKLQGPRILKLNDGTYRMYFTAMSDVNTKDETHMILSATSDDGFNFVKEDGRRLDPTSEPFVGRRVAHAFPILLDNGNVQLFFAGASTEGGGILSAVSENGLDFTVNPYPEIEETFIEEEGIGISPQDPCVISMNGKLRMYYGIYKGPEVVAESAIYSAVYNEQE